MILLHQCVLGFLQNANQIFTAKGIQCSDHRQSADQFRDQTVLDDIMGGHITEDAPCGALRLLHDFAAETDGLCDHHPSHTTDCGYTATGECGHTCTAESGCITVRCSHIHVGTCFDAEGNSLCPHACTDTPACYTPIVECIHKDHSGCGHSEGTDCGFSTNGCPDCENPAIELKGTHVVLTDGTEYHYTGDYITPHITVMVDRVVLVEKEHYTVTYTNNIEVGTATATIQGIESAGYTGTVEIPFTIAKAPGTPEFTLVEIQSSHASLEKTEFDYTGQAIAPAVTVTIDGNVLTAGKDYTVTYANNVEVGTAAVTIRGIATASETIGYTGEVTLNFTIVKTPQPTEPSTPSEPTTPAEPSDPTEPSEPTQPEDPEEEKKPEYKITKGSGSKWRQESTTDLTFTLNAKTDGIVSISIDGKKLDAAHYTLQEDAVVLKNSYLKKLAIGTYRIGIAFADGSTSGTFTVVAAADPSIPTTGDNISIWVTLMLTSLAGLGIGILVLRKRVRN